MKKVYLFIFFLAPISCSSSEFEGKERVIRNDETLITINVPKYKQLIINGINHSQKTKTNIFLTIPEATIENINHNIPINFKEAVLQLTEWMSNGDIQKIVSNKNNHIAYVSLFDDAYDLGIFLEELWKLKTNNKLSILFQQYGVYSTLPERTIEGTNPSWIVEALFRGIHENYHRNEISSSEILTRVGSLSNLNIYDAFIVPTDAPVGCELSKIDALDVHFESRGPLLSDRIIHWVSCEKDKTYVFLWEQGWFIPSEDILIQINEAIE
ncbi:hypothetical protein [Marinicella meishanensis]|uniref:hypothetical protein n=1 Tax=Marinicella meishanensis TaxID=2873263 RepID=UPI001CBB5004|nr:hypothetical protein [Marinicella sp. NBU2979]